MSNIRKKRLTDSIKESRCRSTYKRQFFHPHKPRHELARYPPHYWRKGFTFSLRNWNGWIRKLFTIVVSYWTTCVFSFIDPRQPLLILYSFRGARHVPLSLTGYHRLTASPHWLRGSSFCVTLNVFSYQWAYLTRWDSVFPIARSTLLCECVLVVHPLRSILIVAVVAASCQLI